MTSIFYAWWNLCLHVSLMGYMPVTSIFMTIVCICSGEPLAFLPGWCTAYCMLNLIHLGLVTVESRQRFENPTISLHVKAKSATVTQHTVNVHMLWLLIFLVSVSSYANIRCLKASSDGMVRKNLWELWGLKINVPVNNNH